MKTKMGPPHEDLAWGRCLRALWPPYLSPFGAHRMKIWSGSALEGSGRGHPMLVRPGVRRMKVRPVLSIEGPVGAGWDQLFEGQAGARRMTA